MGTGESGAAQESDEGVGLGGGVGVGAGGVGDVSGGVSVWLGLAMVGVNGGGDKLCSAGVTTGFPIKIFIERPIPFYGPVKKNSFLLVDKILITEEK